MSIVIITGSAGLIGSSPTAFFAQQGLDVVGIDNDRRRVFFAEDASTNKVYGDTPILGLFNEVCCYKQALYGLWL